MSSDDAPRLFVLCPVTRRQLAPFIAIAAALQQRGWICALAAADSHLDDTLRSSGVFSEFVPLEWPVDQVPYTPRFAKAYAGASASLVEQAQVDAEFSDKFADAMCRTAFAAAKSFRATALLASLTAVPEALTIGQRFNAPVYIVADRPFADSAVLPPITFVADVAEPKKKPKSAQSSAEPSTPSLASPFNRLLHWGARQWRQLDAGDRIDKFRTEIGLGDAFNFKYSRLPQLLMISDAFMTRPSDYGDNIAMPGFATLPPALLAAHALEPELLSFLGHSDSHSLPIAPVFVCFGDMPAPEGTVELVVQTLAKLKMRGILAGRIASTIESRMPPHIYVCVKEPPLQLLLPRCSVAVIAGDAADVAVALQSSCAALALWVTPTQLFFAQRLVALYAENVAQPDRSALPLSALDGARLASELTFLNSEAVRARVAAMATRVNAEASAASAALWIERRYAFERHSGVGMGEKGWQPDAEAPVCSVCRSEFTLLNRRHHCRACGRVALAGCLALDTVPNYNDEVMVCQQCFEGRAKLRLAAAAAAEDAAASSAQPQV
jgi:hypothetical protein